LFTEEGGGDRGLYKTTDGGATWNRVLEINATTGVTDVVFSSKNPDVMFAGTYQRMRHVGQMIGGGPDGGVYKSIDGGKKWTKLTRRELERPVQAQRARVALGAAAVAGEALLRSRARNHLRFHPRRRPTTTSGSTRATTMA